MKKIVETDFDMIKEVAHNISTAKKNQSVGKIQDDLPNALGFKLTNRCNLRCKHCYEWNEKGYHFNMSKEEQNTYLDYEIIDKCLSETEKIKSMVYLWGGEPFLYPQIDLLLDRLAKEHRTTSICTNSIKIPDHIEALCKFDHKLELLLALEGDETSNDALRGKGNFQNTLRVLNELLILRSKGVFKGKISIHTMISNENISNLYTYVEQINKMGIDNLTLCYPWYISEKTSFEMDEFYIKRFPWLKPSTLKKTSWHSYKYHIEQPNFAIVNKELDRIRNSNWNINVNILPDVSGDISIQYMCGNTINLEQRPTCFTLFTRMDVLPTGKVSACKHFQELVYGDLSEHSVFEVWNSEEMNHIRQVVKENLMPVCTKCNNLYLHSYKKG